MTSYSGLYDQNAHHGNPLDVQNAPHERNRDTEMLVMNSGVCIERPRRQHFDWCILSVCGYMCCPLFGVCAMYYAMRANHGHDHDIQEYKIQNSSTKAKVLTLLSIIMGSLCSIVMIIVIVVVINKIRHMYTGMSSSLNSMGNEFNH